MAEHIPLGHAVMQHQNTETMPVGPYGLDRRRFHSARRDACLPVKAGSPAGAFSKHQFICWEAIGLYCIEKTLYPLRIQGFDLVDDTRLESPKNPRFMDCQMPDCVNESLLSESHSPARIAG